MRLLFALVIIQCFGYICLKNFYNEGEFKKLYRFKLAEDISNCTHKYFYNNLGQNFIFIEFNSDRQYRENDEREIQYGYCRSLYKNPYSFVVNAKMYKYAQINELEQQQYRKKLSGLEYQQHFSHYEESKNYGRKLLNYLTKNVYRDPIKTDLFHKISDKSYTNIQGISSKENKQETKKTYNEHWDEWGNWSTCSVTCGKGRQVRWRHCSAEDCIKGLKKAQIKPCRLKQCDKSILHWLGIKT